MKPQHIKWAVSSLVLTLAGIGIWNESHPNAFVLPSEHNLQATLLQEYDSTLEVEKATDYEWKEAGSVDQQTLHSLAVSLLQNWNEAPPEYITDGSTRYALEDLFGLLANALRYYNQRAVLPKTLPIVALIGPAQNITVNQGVEVRWEDILTGVDKIEITEKAGIPSTITLDHINLTAAEMLHGMAQVYLMLEEQLRSGGTLPSFVYIVPTSNF